MTGVSLQPVTSRVLPFGLLPAPACSPRRLHGNPPIRAWDGAAGQREGENRGGVPQPPCRLCGFQPHPVPAASRPIAAGPTAAEGPVPTPPPWGLSPKKVHSDAFLPNPRAGMIPVSSAPRPAIRPPLSRTGWQSPEQSDSSERARAAEPGGEGQARGISLSAGQCSEPPLRTSPHAGLVSRLRAAWLSGKTRPMEYRVAQLEALGRVLDEKQQDILEATASDTGKARPPWPGRLVGSASPSQWQMAGCVLGRLPGSAHCTRGAEAFVFAVIFSLAFGDAPGELGMGHWLAADVWDGTQVSLTPSFPPQAMQLDSAFIHKDYGVVLIIRPWNYHINLLQVPLIGAIAAGEAWLCLCHAGGYQNLTGGCPVSSLGWEWGDGGGAAVGAGLLLPKSKVLNRRELLSWTPAPLRPKPARLSHVPLMRSLRSCPALVPHFPPPLPVAGLLCRGDRFGVEETTRLPENKFNYIPQGHSSPIPLFNTGRQARGCPSKPGADPLGGLDHAGLTLLPLPSGSPSVGRIVMAAAAKHLTPVTLELGGKNPCYVSDTCDVQNVARRVAWGRFFNAGQTCAAPNYVLHSTDNAVKLLPAPREAVAEYYGPNPWEPPDFACVVGDKQFQRAQALLRSRHAAIGGQTDAEARYIGEGAGCTASGRAEAQGGAPAGCGPSPSQSRLGSPPAAPTALVDVQQDEPLMQEESFGPIPPILTVASVDDAITFINTQERPLALYLFSSRKKVRSRAGSSIPLSLGRILLRGSIATGALPSRGCSFGLVPGHGRREPPRPQPRVSWCTPGSREEADKGCPVGARHPPALTPQVVNRVPEQTSSGGFCANDTIMHVTLLPFGGIGTSIPRNRVRWDTPHPPPPPPAAPSAGKAGVPPPPAGTLPKAPPALPSPTAPPAAGPCC
ncbi:LOW QUALITY PROTEIN: uncharacterized protein M6G45_008212 [Spheniscus humboldti]